MATSPHTRALLCRLAACEIDNEAHSAANLRRALRDAGLDEAWVARAVARIREALPNEVDNRTDNAS